MSSSEKTTTETLPKSPLENSQGTPGTARPSEISDLTEQLKKLIEKLNAPKRKDLWDIVAILTAFTGTVIMAGISLYVTQSYQRQEAQRTREYQEHESARAAQFNQSQIEIQRAQVRVEELKAITALAPLLASPEAGSRETGRQLLQAVRASGTTESTSQLPIVPSQSSQAQRKPSTPLLDQFAEIALSSKASPQDRVEATQKIGEIATAKSTSPAVRERAADIAARIATSNETPPEVRQAATDVIAKIKRVTAAEVEQTISSERVTRRITQVILHSSFSSANAYAGEKTIFNLAQLQIKQYKWINVGWHYAVAPDGSIWLGAPLNEQTNHAGSQNPTSVSVFLIMDGEKELPTDAQRASLVAVLRTLFARLKLDPAVDSPEGRGFHFHRDYNKTLGRFTTCPGSLLTKEMVLGWL